MILSAESQPNIKVEIEQFETHGFIQINAPSLLLPFSHARLPSVTGPVVRGQATLTLHCSPTGIIFPLRLRSLQNMKKQMSSTKLFESMCDCICILRLCFHFGLHVTTGHDNVDAGDGGKCQDSKSSTDRDIVLCIFLL